MRKYLTCGSKLFEPESMTAKPLPRYAEMDLIKVYPQITFQHIIGFGAALTEASGYVFAQMDESDRREFLERCFAPEFNGYSLCRLAIQSCDFSLAPRSYPNDSRDGKLEGFSIDDDLAYVIPLVADALSVNPELELLASPWSPPAWAKTNRSMLHGGHLRPSSADAWAQMISRFLLEYRKLGVRIGRITVQNEARAIQTWESCLYSAREEAAFVRDHLRPALDACGLSDVKILIWDHNKENVFDRTAACLRDDAAARAIDGIAFHWYSGDHFEALAATSLLAGDRELIFTEGCDFFSDGDPYWELRHAEHYAHEIIGDLEAGANGIIDWNILLDSHGGPNHRKNYCDAPMMYDLEAKRLNVRLPFHYIGHFSRFIKPGAVRMLTSRYTTDLETTSFANPDGSHALVVLNRTERDIDFNVNVNGGFMNDHTVHPTTAPARSIMTITW